MLPVGVVPCENRILSTIAGVTPDCEPIAAVLSEKSTSSTQTLIVFCALASAILDNDRLRLNAGSWSANCSCQRANLRLNSSRVPVAASFARSSGEMVSAETELILKLKINKKSAITSNSTRVDVCLTKDAIVLPSTEFSLTSYLRASSRFD